MNYKDYKDYKGYKDYNNYNSYKGYKSLAVYQQTEIIYDFTVEFCQNYVDKNYKNYNSYKNYSRQSDQMIQAARSGKQNIAEGYLEKSFESRIKLLGVARASLEELLNDYQDFLRQRGLRFWEVNSPEARKARNLVYNHYKNYNVYKSYIVTPGKAANAMICLINQTNQLLDQKLRWTEEKFVKEGGFRENLLKKRLAYRQKQKL